jgi:hypothetical protein
MGVRGQSAFVAKTTPFWRPVWLPSLENGSPQVSLTHSTQIYDILNVAYSDIVLNHANVKSALSQAQQQIVPLLNPK